MGKFVMTKEQFDALWQAIDEIRTFHKFKQRGAKNVFCDNQEFITMMKVSKRQALRWRNLGLIGFSQIGKHIYYSFEDITAFIYKHYSPPLNDSGKALPQAGA